MPQLDELFRPRTRFVKGEFIGRGASKVVFKAFDEEDGIEVAWNEVACPNACLNDVCERARVLGEIQMLRALKHRNIMRLFDYFYDKQRSTLVFITELLTDGSLRRYVRKRAASTKTGLSISVIKRFAWQILQGLVYLHAHYPPIIHRDLKCDNIFINGASGELKLGDLGFATLLRGASTPLSVIGTPEFMAPELYDEQYDEKVDIYSYGMCLLELATLEYPYAECNNPAQIYRKVTRGVPPAALSRVTHPQLHELIALTTNTDPHARPEARRLLAHPFFEDVVRNIRARGWARGPAPALAAAAAAVAAAAGRAPLPPAVAGDGTGEPASTGSGRGSTGARLPLSVPDGMAAILAAAAEAEAAAAAGTELRLSIGHASPARAADLLPRMPSGGSPAAAAVEPVVVSSGRGRLDAGRSCGPVLMAAALSGEWAEGEGEEEKEGREEVASPTAGQGQRLTAVQNVAPRQQQQQQQQQQQASVCRPSSGLQQAWPHQQPEGSTETLEHQGQPSSGKEQHSAGVARTQLAPLRTAGSGSSPAGTPLHSPFASALGSFRSAGSGSTWASTGTWGCPASGSTPGAAGAAGPLLSPVEQPLRHASLEEMSEDDILFDADEQHPAASDDGNDGEEGDQDGDQEVGLLPPGVAYQQPMSARRPRPSLGAHARAGAMQRCEIGAAGADGGNGDEGDDGDDAGIDCAWRQIDQSQLSFHVGFITRGMRQNVGFKYDASSDTVDSLTAEMLDSLSLWPHQATAIADKIRSALAALGLPHGSVNSKGSPLQAATDATQQQGGIGESAAMAILATAAASAAIECAGTPSCAPSLPGSVCSSSLGSAAVPVALINSLSGVSPSHQAVHLRAAASGIADCQQGSSSTSQSASVVRASPPPLATLPPLASLINLSPVQQRAIDAADEQQEQQEQQEQEQEQGQHQHQHPHQEQQGQELQHLAAAQELMHELSLLDSSQGAALLHNLQEELLQHSRTMAAGGGAGLPVMAISAAAHGSTDAQGRHAVVQPHQHEHHYQQHQQAPPPAQRG